MKLHDLFENKDYNQLLNRMAGRRGETRAELESVIANESGGKKTHTDNCDYHTGHDCNCKGKKTHADDCDYHTGHDCSCVLTEGKDKPDSVKFNPVAKNAGQNRNAAGGHESKKEKANRPKRKQKHKGQIDEVLPALAAAGGIAARVGGAAVGGALSGAGAAVGGALSGAGAAVGGAIKGARSVAKGATDDLDEGPIAKGMGAIALIAALWGVNDNMAQSAYDNSPQLQKLMQFHAQATANGDESNIAQLERRIEQHKNRLDIGKGEVMDRDGNPKQVSMQQEASSGTWNHVRDQDGGLTLQQHSKTGEYRTVDRNGNPTGKKKKTEEAKTKKVPHAKASTTPPKAKKNNKDSGSSKHPLRGKLVGGS